jgi:ribonuclease Y
MDNNLVSLVIMFLIGVAVFLAGWFARRLVDRSKIVSAEELAEKIVREAQREGETQKKAAVLEAKDEWYTKPRPSLKRTRSRPGPRSTSSRGPWRSVRRTSTGRSSS